MRLRIRTLKPEFFQDERIVVLSITARYLAVGLITLSDDRGRQRYTVASIRGHVFPLGDEKEQIVKRELDAIVASGFALNYQAGPFEYLWLPKFWTHQVINRPTESDLPAHPDDPYASMSVTDALKVVRNEKSLKAA